MAETAPSSSKKPKLEKDEPEQPPRYYPPTFTSFDLFEYYSDRCPECSLRMERLDERFPRPFEMKSDWGSPWPNECAIVGRSRLSNDADGIISAFLDIFRVAPKKGELWPWLTLEHVTPIPTVYYVLHDDIPGPQHEPIVRAYSSLSPAIFNFLMKFPLRLFHKDFLTSRFMHYGRCSLKMQVHVEPADAVKRCYSRDGRLIWMIGDYQRRLRLEQKGVLERQESEYFYSRDEGYRMQAWLKTMRNGDGVPESLSVEVAFLSGEFDAFLSAAFRHYAIVTVCNPDAPRFMAQLKVKGDIARDRVTRALLPIEHPMLIEGERLEVHVYVQSREDRGV